MKTKFIKLEVLTVFVFILTVLLSGSVFSQNSAKCRLVETIGNAQKMEILNQINAVVIDTKYEISPRKTLLIKNVKSINFKGCKAIVDVEVKLKRKIRRDAKGTIRITAVVDRYTGNQVCLIKSKVDKVRLSNTLRIGEGFYKWIANKVLPNNVCYDL